MGIFVAGVVLWVAALVGSHEYEVQQLYAEIEAREEVIEELRREEEGHE